MSNFVGRVEPLGWRKFVGQSRRTFVNVSGTSVTTDATSGRKIPQNATEWNAISSAPDYLWLCQDASGNAVPTIGGLTLTAAGIPLYQQAISGWSLLGWGFAAGAGQRFAVSAGSGPNPSTTSTLYCAYVALVGAQGGTRFILGNGTNTFEGGAARVTTTPKMQTLCVNASTLGTSNPTLVGMQLVYAGYNRTAGTMTVWTEQEKVTGTYSAGATDGLKGFGGVNGNAFIGQIGEAWIRAGAAAEVTDAYVRAEMTALGASVPW